jgi:hypothetical protein
VSALLLFNMRGLLITFIEMFARVDADLARMIEMGIKA